MNFRRILFVFILILLGLNIFLIKKIKSLNKELISCKDNIDYFNDLKDRYKFQYRISGDKINDKVFDVELEKLELLDLIEVRLICVYVKAKKCSSCTINLLNELKYAQSIKNNLVIMTDFENIRHFKAFVAENNLEDYNIYNFEKLFYLSNKVDANYFFFTLDRELIVSNVYIPSDYFPELTEFYISAM